MPCSNGWLSYSVRVNVVDGSGCLRGKRAKFAEREERRRICSELSRGEGAAAALFERSGVSVTGRKAESPAAALSVWLS